MSLRWRKDNTLICGAKSKPIKDDTYIDDRLHYKLAEEEKIVIPNVDEHITGLWMWRSEINCLKR